jgi:flagellar hook assembly protein FlgD
LSAYPNPFPANGTFGNPSTQIYFAMKEDGIATVRIYNLTGQLVRELLNEYRVVGEHTVPWDGRDHRGAMAASGVYFIRFEAGSKVKVNKVMLVR